MEPRYPSNTIISRGWVLKQEGVNHCPQCGEHDLVVYRMMHRYGSTYLLMCERCYFHPKAVFSFSPNRGLMAALRKWNRAAEKRKRVRF